LAVGWWLEAVGGYWFLLHQSHLLAADRRREVREERSELTRSPTMELQNYLHLIGEEKKNTKHLDGGAEIGTINNGY